MTRPQDACPLESEVGRIGGTRGGKKEQRPTGEGAAQGLRTGSGTGVACPRLVVGPPPRLPPAQPNTPSRTAKTLTGQAGEVGRGCGRGVVLPCRCEPHYDDHLCYPTSFWYSHAGRQTGALRRQQPTPKPPLPPLAQSPAARAQTNRPPLIGSTLGARLPTLHCYRAQLCRHVRLALGLV